MRHPNACLSIYQRRLIVDRVTSGWTVARAARAAGVRAKRRANGPTGSADKALAL